jgi:hypothetical protein
VGDLVVGALLVGALLVGTLLVGVFVGVYPELGAELGGDEE